MNTTTLDYTDLTNYARCFARHWVLQPADADDLAQDVMIDVWTNRETVRCGRAVVYRAVRHRLIDRKRREERRIKTVQAEQVDAVAPQTSDASSETANRLLEHAGHYRPVIERWMAGDRLEATDRKRVERGLALIRESGVTD